MKGGMGGIGRAFSALTGRAPSDSQKIKNIYEKLFSFGDYNNLSVGEIDYNHQVKRGKIATDLLKGLYGVVNIQTELDVIAFQRLYRNLDKRRFLLQDGSALQQEFIAAGSPDPVLGNLMNTANEILKKAGSLLRTENYDPFFVGAASDLSITDEQKTAALNDALALSSATNQRAQGAISATEFIEAITPYYEAAKAPGFKSIGGRRNRSSRKHKSRSSKSRKSRSGKSRKHKSRSGKSRR